MPLPVYSPCMNVPLDELPQDMDQTEKERIYGKENNSHETFKRA